MSIQIHPSFADQSCYLDCSLAQSRRCSTGLPIREIKLQMGEWLMDLGHYRSMDTRTKLDDEIETAEQRATFKQMLLRLLDDPQIQEKIATFLRRSGLTRSTGINVPQRWYP